MAYRSHLKKWILVQYRGGAELKTAGIHQYFEDFQRGTNKDIGPKDFFEIASIGLSLTTPSIIISFVYI
jgi:hypothetical protein